MANNTILAVDIGNARIKLGLFANGCAAGLPEPAKTLPLLGDVADLDAITKWLADLETPTHWWIASVNRPATAHLLDWLNQHRGRDHVTLLASGDLPLEVRVARPDMVGIDRLVDAVAVNRLREAGRRAVIVDVGSAITVDLVSPDGAFLGGAILPGIAMSARALHEFTDLLPLVDMAELTAPPPPLGTATVPAMESGLFWGAVGSIRQLIERLPEHARKGDSPHLCIAPEGPFRQMGTVPFSGVGDPTQIEPQVFLTGGAGSSVAQLLGPWARYVPNLTLAGIALAATADSGNGIVEH